MWWVVFFFHGNLPFLVEKIFWVQAEARTRIIQEQPVVWFRGFDVDIQHSLLSQAWHVNVSLSTSEEGQGLGSHGPS